MIFDEGVRVMSRVEGEPPAEAKGGLRVGVAARQLRVADDFREMNVPAAFNGVQLTT